MKFLYKHTKINLGISLSIATVIIFLLVQEYILRSFLPQFILLLTIIALSALLLYWWKYKITQSYIEKLRLEELEHLQQTIANKEQELEKLRKENDHLSRIIHKDNKLIPAMEYAVCNYLQSASQLKPPDKITEESYTKPFLQLEETGKHLLSQLEEMSKERKGIVHNYETNHCHASQFGIPSIDAILQYMEKRAGDLKIHYRLQFDSGTKDILQQTISEPDALHLLSDLIENAIIATDTSKEKEILIHIGLSYKKLFFDVYDSGVSFTPETYQNFGTQPYTTHANCGGSGIGLTDIWNLKRKYKASLQIYEFTPGPNAYSKKIRILFDRKNHFLIQTYREKEIQKNIIRSDLHIFPYSGYFASERSKEATAT